MLFAPQVVLNRVHHVEVDTENVLVARVLGARHLTQAALSGINPSPEVLAMGVWVDVARLHRGYSAIRAKPEVTTEHRAPDPAARTCLSIAATRHSGKQSGLLPGFLPMSSSVPVSADASGAAADVVAEVYWRPLLRTPAGAP